MVDTGEVFEVTSEFNRVIFSGKLEIKKARICLRMIDQIIYEKGFSDVILDFKNLSFTHPPAMLMLLSHISRFLVDETVEFQVILPKEESVARLFINSNWAHFMCPNIYPASISRRGPHLPVKRFSTAKEQAHSVNEVTETLLSNLTEFSRDHLRAIEWSVNEITDNVLVHSKSNIGGFIQVTNQRTRKRVEFVVADAGIGIAQSLIGAHREIKDEATALTRAIEEGVTRDKSLGQGNGLYGSYRIAIESLGNFSIHANKATLYYANKAGLHSRNNGIEFKGSLVACGIDYTNPFLLQEALKFGGKSYIPSDTIEMKYESDISGEIVFLMLSEAESLGSRESGRPIRKKLLSLWKMTNAIRIIIDMDNIHIISSSFADEVFGKLFVEIGPVQFSSIFQLKNTDPVVRQIIDKSITQRMLNAST